MTVYRVTQRYGPILCTFFSFNTLFIWEERKGKYGHFNNQFTNLVKKGDKTKLVLLIKYDFFKSFKMQNMKFSLLCMHG